MKKILLLSILILYFMGCKKQVAKVPSITSVSATTVLATATINGNITCDGGNAITARGVCWTIVQNPTVDLSTKTTDGTGVGSFTSRITGLDPGTTYYIRPYATNSIGTAYGDQIILTTQAILSTITTTAPSAVTSEGASSGGNITNKGGANILVRGVCWDTAQNPTTVPGKKTTDGTGVGSFSSIITGLTPNTTYYVRSYATNSAGTAFGDQVTLITLALPAGAPEIIDKEVWFIESPANAGKVYRPLPTDPGFRYFSGFPAISSVQAVPFPWGHENFYSGNGGYLTDNVYLEPGKPWVLQTVISTPGTGDSSTGSPQYKCWYRTSLNGGITFSNLKQVIIEGFTSMNPIARVEIGRNGFNVDFTRPVVRASNGEIMIPVCLHPWDEVNGKIYCPVTAAGLFQDAGVLIANWLPDGSDVKWKFGEWLRIDYNKSTRGLSEPTIVETNEPGRFAMVNRCSNSGRPDLPGYAWVSFSNDYCRTWSGTRPFTYSDGANFFVPTAHSTIFKSRKTGRVYWIGDLNDVNPSGSHPRYPLAIGVVDLGNFGLIRNTVIKMDTRHPDVEGAFVQLSNFKVMENVETNEILVVCTRIENGKSASHPSWYRIKL